MSIGVLYAPWRSKYVRAVDKGKFAATPSQECVFCNQIKEKDDEKYFIIRRFPNTIVALNLYPYNSGHLLIMPISHMAAIDQLPVIVQQEMMVVAGLSSTILQTVLKAEGINIGMNLGRIAGAGIPAHLHLHVLPRWLGDTNFLPTLAHTKQISTDLGAIYQQLVLPFRQLQLP